MDVKQIADKAQALGATSRDADKAQALGATSRDAEDVVRTLVRQAGGGFELWCAVCDELADRAARRAGYRNDAHRAVEKVKGASS